MARPALQENHDDGFRLAPAGFIHRRIGRRSLQPKNIRQAQAQNASAADAQKLATTYAIAIPTEPARYTEHKFIKLRLGSFSTIMKIMSTVAEIRAALPNLSSQELQSLDAALREQFRARKIGIIYDDAYGVWTEDDQTAVAAEAFAILDQEEKNAKSS